ncbi:MAG: flagellar motor stator protein MotA [Hyphomicrobiaceae bacterium]
MTVIIGLVITLGCMLGGFTAMGGHVEVIWQPWEFVIILGMSIGTFVVANPMKIIKDASKGFIEAFKNVGPTDQEYLELLGLLYALMREIRSKPRSEVEAHVEKPDESPLFQNFPLVLANEDLMTFICDYCRLILIGNARTHEIEALMDEEISTLRADKLKSYHSMYAMSEGLPAIGIVAAVLGVIKAMGSLDKPPEYLGKMIGAALVGTFAGIFFSYSFVSPIATKMKTGREKRLRLYVIAKQSLLAFMNGAMPQVAVEHGRKAISAYERPTIDEVEQQISGGGGAAETQKKAA